MYQEGVMSIHSFVRRKKARMENGSTDNSTAPAAPVLDAAALTAQILAGAQAAQAAAQAAPAPEAASAVSAAAQPAAPVVVSQSFRPFTEVVICSDISKKLAQGAAAKLRPTNGDPETDQFRRYWISMDGSTTSQVLNQWAAGAIPLTLFGDMDTNGIFRKPIVLGAALGLEAAVIIQVSGVVIYDMDATGNIVGTPRMSITDTFAPVSPTPVQPTLPGPSADAAQAAPAADVAS